MNAFRNVLVKLSGVCALLVSLPVIYRIYEGDLLNPTSYFLWSSLSLVCFVVLIRANEGGHTMMVGYFLSDLCIGTYALIKGGQSKFGWFEILVICLTVICAAIFARCELRKKYNPAVIASGIACVVAGIPLLIDAFVHPYKMSYMICLCYLAISLFGYFGETTFKGKFIPGLSAVYWLVILGGVAVERA
ncbi:MAG TPA: hypothetical protein VFT82_04200 [Candidatus Paceibacterota bacterium]|nr:hypothetical protein [Candidatus Paceibacterota bacterium]